MKDVREIPNPAAEKLAYRNEANQNSLLVGDCFELIGRIDETRTDPVGKLDCREEVADAETKAHGDFGEMVSSQKES